MEPVGDRIKRLRHERTPIVTQQALASAIGVTRSAIAQVEGGISNSLNAENITKAARFFGRNSLWLATGEGPEHSSDAVSNALDALPDEQRQQAFDFLLYQLNRAEHVFAERPADYTRMIEGITADMKRRKSASEQKPTSRRSAPAKPVKKPQ